MGGVNLIASDLTPGDQRSTSFSWNGIERVKITSPEDPLFHQVYEKLWAEFGAKGEVEQKDVLTRRLQWDPANTDSEYSLGYDLIGVFKQGKFVAARDHTAIVRRGESPEAIVHLSHALIMPEFRGTGLAGWLRAWPIQTARSCLTQAGMPEDSPITLIAEMEPLDLTSAASVGRLKSYQKAGFRMVDPGSVDFLQPDFRAPSAIDASGGPQPLSLRLVIRRLGRELETELPSAEVRRMISSLYQMYSATFRAQDMKPVQDKFLKSSVARRDFSVRLLDPLKDPS